jgi:spore coat polysaccharide biosynthesis predicted glycosyltransferase SpsG
MGKNRPRVTIRADGSNALGMGHVYRDLNLADALSMWADVHFLTMGDEIAAAKMSEKYPTTVTDKEEEFTALGGTRNAAIIVDKLNTETAYMGHLKGICDLLVSFDDCGEGVYESDLAFNVLYHCPPRKEKNIVFYTDPSYAIINPRFSTVKRRESQGLTRVLVTLGGADTLGLTPHVLRTLDSMAEEFEVTTVIGPAFKHHEELEEIIGGLRRRVDIRHNIAEMWRAMADSDIAVSAGGNTLFELAATGTPAIVLCEEVFEVETADRLEAYGTCVNLGYSGNYDGVKLAKTIRELLLDRDRIRQMSAAGQKLVDGRGAERVSGIIKMHLKKRRFRAPTSTTD